MLELNKIYCTDNREGLKLLPDNSIDLTVTSPPYDNLREYKGYSFDFETVAQELYRVTKQGGVVVWVVDEETTDGGETGNCFRQALRFMELGFRKHDTMIYAKDGGPFPEKTRYTQVFEYMFVFSKGAPKTVNLIKDKRNSCYGDKVTGSERRADGGLNRREKTGKQIQEYGARGNIWHINCGYMKTTRDKEAYSHPAMFPEKLAIDHILSWSNPGDLILDPFMGSGTTAKMAAAYGRDYIGFEISPEYCEIAEKRIKEATSQQRMFTEVT